jgi:hypothetical protein
MMNAIPGTYSGHLASPFLLVHGVGHDEHTWIPLFSLCYFHHKKDSAQQRSKHQAHTMDGIVIGHSPTLNALMVYNPRNQQCYKPVSYRINPYRLPALVEGPAQKMTFFQMVPKSCLSVLIHSIRCKYDSIFFFFKMFDWNLPVWQVKRNVVGSGWNSYWFLLGS